MPNPLTRFSRRADPCRQPYAIDLFDWTGSHVVCSEPAWNSMAAECAEIRGLKRTVERLLQTGGTVKTEPGTNQLHVYGFGYQYELALHKVRSGLRLTLHLGACSGHRLLYRIVYPVTDFMPGEVEYRES